MSYTIICDAREGSALGIEVLGLVDRDLWWTSDAPALLKRFPAQEDAERLAARLLYSRPRVVDFEAARRLLAQQARRIEEEAAEREHEAALGEDERGWDGHKNAF